MSGGVSRNKVKKIFSPSIKCECCGRILVLLREPEWTEKNRAWAACYARGWDGNPWYVSAHHRRHPRNWYAEFKREQQKIVMEDAFFTL